ncbi:MAG: hypothetical protein ACTSP4_03200 [Candidatus Hodarchaeales archaeon]
MLETILEDLILEISPQETLFVVSCTKMKIWDTNSNVPDYIEAKKAYKIGFIKIR